MSNAMQSYTYLTEIPNYADATLQEKPILQHRYTQKLLAYAYRVIFSSDIAALNLRQLQNGKWVCDKHFFSLSHSGGFVAVTVSDSPVGVDLQKFTYAHIDTFARKFFTSAEQRKFTESANKIDCFFFTWCKKEALWKSLDNQPPTVFTLDTTLYNFTLRKLNLNNDTFYLAVTNQSTVEIVTQDI